MKRKKSVPLTRLKKKLWSIFSEFTRRRFTDSNGMVACISCGNLYHWKEIHAGHYHAGSTSLALYFDERNVHPQCVGCNTYRHGNLAKYALALIDKYGQNILRDLDLDRHKRDKFTRGEYEQLIEIYTERLKALESGVVTFGTKAA